MKTILFKEDFSLVDQDGTLTTDCNSITVINTGLVNVKLNGLTLIPGAQYVSDGNIYEINETRYQLSLNGGSITVIRKNYIQ